MKPEKPAKPEKIEAVGPPVSDDLDPGRTQLPVKTCYQGRVPGTKRKRKFQRQCERAKRAIVAGEIEPKARPIAEHCQCAYRTALSILSVLTDQGIVEREGRGWKRAA